ncbi:hypothetical protein [Kitasatospora cheerisanensis]|uniref:Secreted protein n=1 Tax=Kitasatospora cheerisanensis KCTC 2395 TaxID=1348663 RepID=A0A066Z583_9ACTN|nr:hypothetical protein [Kitasatospora cheerisanensis]KDN87409.1 hypothetical protein KCH_07810 [Kitasatospora cheerisanensis KCTC 2395]
MNRITRLAVAAAGAAALLTAPVPAFAAATGADTVATTTTTCKYSLQAGLATYACADVTGDSVVIYGKIGLAGPPDGPVGWQTLYTNLSAEVVGGASLGSVSGTVPFHSTGVRVEGFTATVACGSTVRVTFSVQGSGPFGTRPVLDVPVTC